MGPVESNTNREECFGNSVVTANRAAMENVKDEGVQGVMIRRREVPDCKLWQMTRRPWWMHKLLSPANCWLEGGVECGDY